MGKRFLVVVRAGDESLHPTWLQTRDTRNWDLIVNYYGDDTTRFPAAGEGFVRIDSKGPKWPALARLMTETQDAWSAYDYVWFPDDDLATTGDDINRMFEVAVGLELHLAQPSLSWDSHIGVPLTLHNRSFSVRFSSFVEPMAPLFSAALLRRALPTFGETISGWGLDYVWPQLLDNPARQCAILDCIQVRHTRPAGGPNYAFNNAAGIEPRKEMHELLQRHGIPGPTQMCFGGIDAAGRFYNLFDKDDETFVSRLCSGYLELKKGSAPMIGSLFIEHALARQQFLAAQSGPAASRTNTPAHGARPLAAPTLPNAPAVAAPVLAQRPAAPARSASTWAAAVALR